MRRVRVAMVIGVLMAVLVSRTMAASADSYTEWRWIVDVMPASIEASLEADRFSVRGSDVGFPGRAIADKESVSLLSTMPTLAAGVGIETMNCEIDLKVGGGMLLNQRLRTPMLFASAGLAFEIQRSIWFGPHIGYNWYTDPEWWGDADITFADSDGVNLGVSLVMGDKLSYFFSADYYDISFLVDEVGPGWIPSADKLDMSGVAVQFGIRAQF